MIAGRAVLRLTALTLLAAAGLGCVHSAPSAGEREPDEPATQAPLPSAAGVPHVVVAEAFVSAARRRENIDSPASWRDADGRLRVAVTAKKTGQLVIYDGDNGQRLQTLAGKGKALGQLDRPNGIAVVDGLALVVERDNHRVQVFSLPRFEPLLVFGQDDLRQPYGLWAERVADGIEVIVSDNYMLGADQETVPPLDALGQRFRRYQLTRQQGGWSARLVQSFGDTGSAGAIRISESLWGDRQHQRLLIAEEDVATGTRLREYRLDGRYAGRDVGAGVYRAQAEGIALMRCADGSGWWIGTDQYKDRSVFHLFDRNTLQHVGSFAGKLTANTDGVWLDEQGDARFPQGVFYAVHDDQALAAFDWRDVASALQLKPCPR